MFHTYHFTHQVNQRRSETIRARTRCEAITKLNAKTGGDHQSFKLAYLVRAA